MAKADNNKWVAIWGNAMSINENKPEAYARNITLRYKIYCPFQGTSVRLTFDNYCGKEPVYISKACVNHHSKALTVTFNGGYEGMWINPGATMLTDDIRMNIKAGETFDVSFYLGEYTSLRSSVLVTGPLSAGQYAIGDMTEMNNIPIDISRRTNTVYFLSNVSVYTKQKNRAVVCYGDSITAQDWPDYLKLKCMEKNMNSTAIIRRAASGTRILREYSCIKYESYGLKGSKRFDHEVPTEGADTVIIQQGINDIIHPVGIEVNPFRPMKDLPTLEQLKYGMNWYIERAKSYGMLVYVGTLLPIKGWRTYAPFREELRQGFNEWIRHGADCDGVIDFDRALRDFNDRTAFEWAYDSGDHLHPSVEGYMKMADTVPEDLLW